MTAPTIQLYDTAARAKRVFEPIDRTHVRMYACGPTVYDRIHIGNGRSFIVFDVLYRLLKAVYPRVTYVRNITDVDDKINARAAELGVAIGVLTSETEQIFHADMTALGALEPDVEPRATAHIAQMQALIETLLDNGHAYVADGHVLFAVDTMPDYGSLSRLNRDALIAGARVEVAPYKKDPADFVLWKPSHKIEQGGNEPGWDSPWGYGRPGWHLECSAMSSEYLGPEFDIHGGGLDLVFPHHENEIAQSRCAGHAFAHYWVHNGYVMSEGEKMSKSQGNFYLVHDLLEEFGPTGGESLRLAMLKTHYRQPLDFTKAGVNEARAELDSFYATLHKHENVEPEGSESGQVLAALADDFNTPLALTRLHELRGQLNSLDPSDDGAARLKGELLASGEILGLIQTDPNEWRKRPSMVALEIAVEKNEALPITPHGVEDWIVALIEQRQIARQAKKFAEADKIRDVLAEQGIILEDRPDGTTDWRRET